LITKRSNQIATRVVRKLQHPGGKSKQIQKQSALQKRGGKILGKPRDGRFPCKRESEGWYLDWGGVVTFRLGGGEEKVVGKKGSHTPKFCQKGEGSKKKKAKARRKKRGSTRSKEGEKRARAGELHPCVRGGKGLKKGYLLLTKRADLEREGYP